MQKKQPVARKTFANLLPGVVFTIILNLILSSAIAQSTYELQPLDAPPITSVRGMSVVSDDIMWISGTDGKAGRTTDGGINWQWFSVPGHDSSDWRSIVAFSAERALLLNAGEPAFIMLTTDGGSSWQQVYKNTAKGIFFDGMTFTNTQEGMAIGDPIDGRFTIIRTSNGGTSWEPAATDDLPTAQHGEAIFAASGTSVFTIPGGRTGFVTGGTDSRFFVYGKQWQAIPLPMAQGLSSTGAFSAAFRNASEGVAVGGDYRNDTLVAGNCALTHDGGLSWEPSPVPPAGFRSCVQYVSEKLLIATGTSGTDVSDDGGLHWRNISRDGYHVMGVTQSGNKIWLAGSGKLARLVINQKN